MEEMNVGLSGIGRFSSVINGKEGYIWWLGVCGMVTPSHLEFSFLELVKICPLGGKSKIDDDTIFIAKDDEQKWAYLTTILERFCLRSEYI